MINVNEHTELAPPTHHLTYEQREENNKALEAALTPDSPRVQLDRGYGLPFFAFRHPCCGTVRRWYGVIDWDEPRSPAHNPGKCPECAHIGLKDALDRAAAQRGADPAAAYAALYGTRSDAATRRKQAAGH